MSASDPVAEYIFFENFTTSSEAVEKPAQNTIAMTMTHHSFILSAGLGYPFIQALDQYTIAICYTFSLLLAYALTVALIVTACCMHYEPTMLVVIDEECMNGDYEV